MEIKITKKQCILQQYNDMVSNEYWLVNGKIYNDNKTLSKSFRLVIWYDLQDIQEYLDQESVSEKDKKIYVDELAASYTDLIEDFNNTTAFYNACNKTINNYNRLFN